MPVHPFELVGHPHTAAPVVFSCEHASNSVFEHLELSEHDRSLLDDHWGWDVGAADVTRRLVQQFGSTGVLAGFSRLLCDPNRPPEDATWIREDAHGIPISFNLGLDDAARRLRRSLLYEPYHEAISGMIEHRRRLGTPFLLFTVHSFTPMLGEEKRPMEYGVLFDHHEDLAVMLADALKAEDAVVALNEPYSGKKGLIYAAARHGRIHETHYLEIEIRQDLLATEAGVEGVTRQLGAALKSLLGQIFPQA